MTKQQSTLAILLLGALVLALSLYAALFSGLAVWSLHQRIKISRAEQNSQTRETILPSRYLIEAPSHGAAGAALLARLRQAARQSGVSLQRAEPRAADPADPHSVKIAAQARGQTRDLAAFLYAIEARPPALIVQRARLDSGKNKQIALDILVAARARYKESGQ